MKLLQKSKKSLGQNFLIDKNIINKILKVIKVNKNNTVLEVGSGYGNLTKAIMAMQPRKLIAIEKDKKLFSFLNNQFVNYKNMKIINEDVLNLIKKKKFRKKYNCFW